MSDELPPVGKSHYIIISEHGHRKYFGSYKEAKEWVVKNPIRIPDKKGTGTYHIYPVDTKTMGGNKKGNEIEIYSTSEHKHDEDEKGEATCAKCGLSWMLVYKY